MARDLINIGPLVVTGYRPNKRRLAIGGRVVCNDNEIAVSFGISPFALLILWRRWWHRPDSDDEITVAIEPGAVRCECGWSYASTSSQELNAAFLRHAMSCAP